MILRNCLPPNLKYSEYEAWLLQEYSQITLEPHCTEVVFECGPTTSLPDRAPWQMEWCVTFQDQMYFAARENWSGKKYTNGLIGYRREFSFHYGPVSPNQRRTHGIPARDKLYAAIIRVHSDWTGPHIHFRGEDHIPAHRIQGLSIPDVDAFSFVRAVQEHRRTGAEFDAIMGFEVVP